MPRRLDGKVAIITGTARGQGAAAARLFAAEGAKIIGCDLDRDLASEVCQEVVGSGGQMCLLSPLDLTAEEAPAELVSFALDQFGAIDILYNNAGTAWFGHVDKLTRREWRDTMAHELELVFTLSRACWPHLIASGGGAILNTASVAAHRASDLFPAIAHASAKAGVVALTRQLAAEGGVYGIRANSISPGPIETGAAAEALGQPGMRQELLNRMLLKRLGRPEDVANLALFLCSDEAAWITGADMAVDGGMMAFA